MYFVIYSSKLPLTHFIYGQTQAERSHVMPKIAKSVNGGGGFKLMQLFTRYTLDYLASTFQAKSLL